MKYSQDSLKITSHFPISLYAIKYFFVKGNLCGLSHGNHGPLKKANNFKYYPIAHWTTMTIAILIKRNIYHPLDELVYRRDKLIYPPDKLSIVRTIYSSSRGTSNLPSDTASSDCRSTGRSTHRKYRSTA